MKILGIDSGTYKSSYALLNGNSKNLVEKDDLDNRDLLTLIRIIRPDVLVIENIKSYGRAVGQSIFDTCRWIGRFQEAFEFMTGKKAVLVFRNQVQIHFCGTTRCKDSEVNMALMNRYGGDRKSAVGNKKNKGKLYGIKGQHQWDSLSLCIFYIETFADEMK